MKAYQDRLETLKAAAFQDFESDETYKSIRVDVIQLWAEVQATLTQDQLPGFKSDVMHVLYEICGTHLDLEVLEAHTPGILSNDDFGKITQNSTLARWM